jgi:hypothetical protein
MFRSNLGNVRKFNRFLEVQPFSVRMAPTPGKRKRKGTEAIQSAREVSEESSDGQDGIAQDIFRRHFEAHFKPLPMARQAAYTAKEAPTDDEEGESEWEGISEPEGALQIRIS